MTFLRDRSYHLSFAATLVVLALALVPLPGKGLRSILRSVRSAEMNRADRETHAVGYYVGLIDGVSESSHDELTMRLQGKTSEWKNFHEIGATRYLNNDFLQFELKPNLDKTVFGRRFTTNAEGLRDRPYRAEKPAGTFRIALLGSSMDMGWGVGTDETYENLLEDWLNAHAARRGISRRFEVINFAMAAYSPLHRLESFGRKAKKYHPDLVLYSATMLDTRLLEIHLRNLLQQHLDLRYEFLRKIVAMANIPEDDLKLDGFGNPRDKASIKSRLRPYLWDVIDQALNALDEQCRAGGTTLAMVLIPRVGQADAPEARGDSVRQLSAIATRYKLPLIDLTATFDDREPTSLQIAPWDDHPNDLGHRLLFQAFANDLARNAPLYRTIFGVDPPSNP